MSERVFAVPERVAKSAWVDNDTYLQLYKQSIDDPEGFWAKQGQRVDWIKPFTKVKDVSFHRNVHIKWFYDGTLNVSINCLDRHLASRGDQVALLWEGDDPNASKILTYRQLHHQVCKFANVLRTLGIKKGDRVTIYLQMILELPIAMLACARIGAVHSVVFGGFSPESLAGRIQNCDSSIIITADEGVRAGRKVPLKVNTDEAWLSKNGILLKKAARLLTWL